MLRHLNNNQETQNDHKETQSEHMNGQQKPRMRQKRPQNTRNKHKDKEITLTKRLKLTIDPCGMNKLMIDQPFIRTEFILIDRLFFFFFPKSLVHSDVSQIVLFGLC